MPNIGLPLVPFIVVLGALVLLTLLGIGKNQPPA